MGEPLAETIYLGAHSTPRDAITHDVEAQIKRADKVSAFMEATQIAGFSVDEAVKFFGRPAPELLEGLVIRLRPPVEVRAAFTARHETLLEMMT